MIGEHVWITCRNTVLKGAIIGTHFVLAAGSVIAIDFPGTNQLISGN